MRNILSINLANEKLITAARVGNYKEVLALIRRGGADVNARDNEGNTVLIVAVSAIVELLEDGEYEEKNARLIIIKFLIDNEAKIDETDKHGRTALIKAISYGHVDIVKMLLDKGADVNAMDKEGYTALMIATERRHENIVQMLLDKGADVDARNKEGYTALMIAAATGHRSIAQMFLGKRADIDARNNEGYTALMIAAATGHGSIAQMFLGKGAGINVRDNEGYTALMDVEEIKYSNLTEECKILLNERKNKLNKAVWSRNYKEVLTLIGRGEVLIDPFDEDRTAALMIMAERGHISMVQMFSYKRRKVHNIALMIATERGHVSMVQMFLDKEASVYTSDNEGNTILMIAAEGGHVDIVQMLFNRRADVNTRNNEGYTALMIAVEGGHVTIVRMLLARGADINAMNNEGDTAFMIAKNRNISNRTECLKILKMAANDKIIPVAKVGNYKEVLALIRRGEADVNTRNNKGNTALIIALKRGYTSMVQMLLSEGADVYIKNNEGNTALMIAKKLGRNKLVPFLTQQKYNSKKINSAEKICKDLKVQDSDKEDRADFMVLEEKGSLEAIEKAPEKAFNEEVVKKGQIDLSTEYNIYEFLEDNNVIALIEFEYARITTQSIAQARQELHIINIIDEPRISGWSQDNKKIRLDNIQNAVTNAVIGQPSFLIIADGLHWVSIGLLPDLNIQGTINIVYINSAYGEGAEQFIACKTTGLDLLQKLIDIIEERENHNDRSQKLKTVIAQIYSNPTQQLGNNCGAIVALNVAFLAKYWNDQRGRNLNFSRFSLQIASHDVNKIFSIPEQKRKINLFTNYLKSKFLSITTLELHAIPSYSEFYCFSLTEVTFRADVLDRKTIQIIKSELEEKNKNNIDHQLKAATYANKDLNSKISQLPSFSISALFDVIERHRAITKENIGTGYTKEELESAYNLVTAQFSLPIDKGVPADNDLKESQIKGEESRTQAKELKNNKRLLVVEENDEYLFPRCEYYTRYSGTSHFAMEEHRYWGTYFRSTAQGAVSRYTKEILRLKHIKTFN